jgi:nicotinamidase-related amidase
VSEFKPALMVVDVQNGFVTAASAHVVPIITNLVRRWQDADGDVIFTRYYNYSGSPFERLIGWYGLHASPDTELVDDLIPFTHDPHAHVIDKKVYTAFTDDGRQLVEEQGFTDLFICGIATDGCILKTTLDAFELGYTPWVLADAVASNASTSIHRPIAWVSADSAWCLWSVRWAWPVRRSLVLRLVLCSWFAWLGVCGHLAVQGR